MIVSAKSKARDLLGELAPLLQYPDSRYGALLEKAIASATGFSAASAEPLFEFKKQIGKLDVEKLEEIYTRTFDLAPLCIPYLSSHIYGDENFERGALMSRLSERYTQCAFETNGELPDHLALVLRFAPHFEEEEFAELIEFCLQDVISKMVESLKDADNPFCLVLKSVQKIVESEREASRP